MTDVQRLFLVQARSNYAVFALLRAKYSRPHCHALYSLQMATELLGKAYAWRNGPLSKQSHRALVPFIKELGSNTRARDQLGYKNQNANWQQLLRKIGPLAKRLEDLAPALAKETDGPNHEYPWPSEEGEPTECPAEYDFPLWAELIGSPTGRQFLNFLERLFEVAEAYL